MPVILFVLFLVVPIVELAVILQVGEVIGVLATVLLLLAVSVAGAILVRREGTRAWRRFREALAQARLPTTEVIDGALVVLGGALMLTPGFVTDAAGLLLVIPLTRPVFRRLVASRVRVATFGDAGPFASRQAGTPPRAGRRTGRPNGGSRPAGPRRSVDDDGDVVDIEVVSIERNELPGHDDDDNKRDDA